MRTAEDLTSGVVLTSIFYRRLFHYNQNILCAITGKTGSGKSYASLSICENYYKTKLNREYPIDNVCFSINEVLDRLSSGELKRGDILILEEGGVNLGALDFQQKIVKTFNYILQSFRSMNVGLIINLPMFTNLNKTTRNLMHFLIRTMGIDKANKMVRLSPLWLQYNQDTGKLYRHRPVIAIDGFFEKVDIILYPLPSDKLRAEYEAKKKVFLDKLVEDITETNRCEMRDEHKEIYILYHTYTFVCSDIAEKLGKSPQAVQDMMKSMTKAYPNWKNNPKLLGNLDKFKRTSEKPTGEC